MRYIDKLTENIHFERTDASETMLLAILFSHAGGPCPKYGPHKDTPQWCGRKGMSCRKCWELFLESEVKE